MLERDVDGFFAQLTYLLQNSLSGNSKTLVSIRVPPLIRMEKGTVGTNSSEQMFLNLSPLAAHLNESLCSLRFATKASIQIS
jgi:kinesin family protein C1